MKPSRSTLHLYDRILDGELRPMLIAWRNEEPPVTYTEIVVRLREYGITTTQETVRRWWLHIESESAEVAS